MTTQPEYILEENLVEQLQDLGYTKVNIKDEDELVTNLKSQLEKHNRTTFSEAEFRQIRNQLSKGNIYEKAKTLRDRITYAKDNGETGYVELINQVLIMIMLL